MNFAVKISLFIVGCSCLANMVNGRANPSQVVSYLERYGYLEPLDPVNGKLRTHDELVLAVKKLQLLLGTPQNGRLDDPDLLKFMETPRCGMRDDGNYHSAKRKRRYTLQGSYWYKKDLTYKIINYSPDFKDPKDIDNTIQAAFNEWAKVSSLTFTRVDGDTKADINVKFVTGFHDDGYPFDGPGNVLAHAFYPQDNKKEIYGDAHFDDDELFTINTNSGVDLFWVAVHEFGHSLGLDHSNVYDAVMFPYYKGYVSDFKLNDDDVRGIQALYGSPGRPDQTTTPVPQPATPTPHTQTEAPHIPDKCSSSMDAFVMSANGLAYAFKGKYFWPIGEDYGAWTTALRVDEFWGAGLDGDIDASFLDRSNNITYIIKGDKFWMFIDRSAVVNYPLPITDERLNFSMALASPDAAFQWDRNTKVYIFKGTQYWRYDLTFKVIDYGYPRQISDAWRGVIPDNLDAAIQWKNKKSYFFKGKTYTAMDDYSLTVPKEDPPYPRSIGRYWMACSESGEYMGGKILPGRNSVNKFIPNVLVLIFSLILTTSF